MIAETKQRATLTDVWQCPRLGKQNPVCDRLARSVFTVQALCFSIYSISHLSRVSSLHLLYREILFRPLTPFPFLFESLSLSLFLLLTLT